MGKKGSWLYALSCVVRPEPDEKKNKKTRKLQRSLWKQNSQDLESEEEVEIAAVNPTPPSVNPLPPSVNPISPLVNPVPPSPRPGVEWIDPESEEARDGYSVVEAENEGEVTPEADGEVVQLATAASPPVKSKEEVAANKIQGVFRGYMARRSFRAVKGLMRLERLVLGQSVKRQATTTLSYMQTMARVQHQVGARRIRMSEENQALHRQLQQRHDLEKSKTSQVGEDWDDSTKSKEEVEANRIRQQQAAIKRERTLAYAYTHQQTWRNSQKHATQNLMDPHTSQWGWNWLEKWMAARPWENKTIEEELSSEPPSAKSVTTLAHKARRDLNIGCVKSSPSPKKQTHTSGRLSVSSSQASTPKSASVGRVSVSSSQATTPKSASAGRVRTSRSSSRSVHSVDDDARSMQSTRSEHLRRRSEAGSSIRDDESQSGLSTPRTSLSRTSSALSRTSSAKSRSRSSMEKSGRPEKESVGSAKKILSRNSSARSRQSEPPQTPEVQ